MTEDEGKATVQVVDEDGVVRAEYQYGQPTPEAARLMEMLQTAVEEHAKLVVAEGKMPSLKDALSAITGLLGSFLAGAPTEALREHLFKQVGVMLQVAIQMSLEHGGGQPVRVVKKDQMQ